MVAWRFATLCLILIVPTIAAAARVDQSNDEYQVIRSDLELMIEPTHSAYSTGRLKRGDHVVMIGMQPGWVQVKTPSSEFHWINAGDVEERSDGTCVVSKRQVEIRFAAESARLPGPPVRLIRKGTVVRPIDHPDLIVLVGGKSQTWRAIEATNDDVRYLEADGLETIKPQPPPVATGADIANRPERRARYEPATDDANLPPEVNAELVSIDAMGRSIRAASVETWNLDPVRGRYDSLLRQFGTNPKVLATVEPKLDQVRREMELAKSAQAFAQLLKAGDQRDAAIAHTQQTVALAQSSSDRGYDAQGLLQPSSRRYQGKKVLALVGPEGRTTSYLEVPPGIPINQYLTQKVGVRGVVHFDEGLGARLISVRDLELIVPKR